MPGNRALDKMIATTSNVVKSSVPKWYVADGDITAPHVRLVRHEDMVLVPQNPDTVTFHKLLNKGDTWKELSDITEHVCQCGDVIKAEDWIRHRGRLTHKSGISTDHLIIKHNDTYIYVCKLCSYPKNYKEPLFLRFLRWLVEAPTLEQKVKRWLLKGTK